MFEDYVMYCPDIFVSPTVEQSFLIGVTVGYLFIGFGFFFVRLVEFFLKIFDRKRNSPPRGEDKNSN